MTANMGPGSDSFSMAFRHYDEVSVWLITGTTRVIVEGVGAETVPTDDNSLVMQMLRAGPDAIGAPQAGFEMRCVNRILHGGGMGSSASAVVAGLMLACDLIAEPEALSDDRIFVLATDFEGHPDNVASAVFGGATVVWVGRGGCPRMVSIPLDASLGVSLLAPPAMTRLSIKEARQALPVSVPCGDILLNTSWAAVLILALAGYSDLLMVETEGRLHQEHRRGVLPASMAVMDLPREQGYLAVIPDVGLMVLVLSTLVSQTCFVLENHGWSVFSPGIDTRGAVLTS